MACAGSAARSAPRPRRASRSPRSRTYCAKASPGVPSGNIRDAETCANGALTLTNSTTAPDQLDIIHGAGES